MDLITLNRIKLLHPAVRTDTLDIYQYINSKLLSKNVRLRFAHTLRSFTEQDNLYAIGRTKPGKKVTNAKAGQSIHNYGLAFDIVLLTDKNSDGNFETASWDIRADNDKDGQPDWMEVVNYFKSKGWMWGGDWKSFPDYPHFERTFGYNWKILQEKYNSGDVFTEVIDGITYKWVNL
ncbi:M15 family peptidase [Flavobacterium sp. Sd200]|uniref:M15 family metallopeptidase n=1 Tax=Flavobacterium sp. Sd200 TaxID=2692211 RepID=UPI00136A2D81|nr:M15 family metallopeptidase [Flavobacterium sp. Sd200]MXN91307.1 M15 family peptidase [Flavobacterium sp. Sd200]